MAEVSQHLVSFADRCDAFARSLTRRGLKGAPEEIERSAARATAGGGGKGRAQLLSQLASEPAIQLVQVTVLLRGFATLVSEAEATGRINQTAVAAVVRAELEAGSLLFWLFEPGIDAEQRCRRYLSWRLADLGQMRRSVGALTTPTEPDVQSAGVAHVQSLEDELLDLARTAHLAVRPTNGSKRTVLLDTDGRVESPPSLTELVDRLAGVSGTYAMLSTATHGSRWNLVGRLKAVETRGDITHAELRPGGPPSRLAGLMAVQAALGPCLRIDQWKHGEQRSEAFRRVQRAAETLRPALLERTPPSDMDA